MNKNTDSAELFVGRKEELKLLERLYRSKQAEFLAIYGRRRIGKTFLVRHFFRNKGIFFTITGSPNAKREEQLLNFHREYCALFCPEGPLKPPKNWSEAFFRLKEAVKKIQPEQKVVLFFDELPWLSSPKSGFLSALDYSWNQHLSWIPNVLLIVCGSAAAWMVNQVLNNKGGLYGRLSAHLRLVPFTLSETELYLQSRGIQLPRQQICEIYMVTGGVPKYLSYLEPGRSVAECIERLCFTPQAPLLTEFHKLYHSLFRHPESHIEIVKTLAKARHGLDQRTLLKKAKLSKSGRVSDILNELLESGFLMKVPKVGKEAREAHYYLSDEYSFFYLNWIDEAKGELLQGNEEHYWLKRQNSQSFRIWAGYAFETLCLKAIDKIKAALGISAVSTTTGYWRSDHNGKKEVEVDLVIDRKDGCINLAEIKFYQHPLEMNQDMAKDLQLKKALFQSRTGTKKALFTVLISASGVIENPAFLSSVDHQITVDELF